MVTMVEEVSGSQGGAEGPSEDSTLFHLLHSTDVGRVHLQAYRGVGEGVQGFGFRALGTGLGFRAWNGVQGLGSGLWEQGFGNRAHGSGVWHFRMLAAEVVQLQRGRR